MTMPKAFGLLSRRQRVFFDIFILFVLSTICRNCSEAADIAFAPHLPEYSYTDAGDLDLGVVFNFHRNENCSVPSMIDTKVFYLVKWAVEKVNSDETLLPGIKLGLRALDGCRKEGTVLTQLMKFLPRRTKHNATVYYERPVVGVIGAGASFLTVVAAHLLSAYEIPHNGDPTTSDELSNKARFSYFFRSVLPDKFQARAMVDTIEYFGWSYISLVYTDESYGINGARWLRKLAEERGICLAADIKIRKSMDNEQDYKSIVTEIQAHQNARVVILFLTYWRHFIQPKIIEQLNPSGHFIIFTSDAWGTHESHYSDLQHTGLALFSFWPYRTAIDEFTDYFNNLSIEKERHVLWFREYYESNFNCKFGENGKLPVCPNSGTIGRDGTELEMSVVADAVFVFAQAIHLLRQASCPLALFRLELQECISGPKLRQKIFSGTFNGTNGPVKFDKNGDGTGKYGIYSYQKVSSDKFGLVNVGNWEYLNERLLINASLLRWNRDMKWEIPESMCAKPCPKRKYVFQLSPHCCWECRECRINEVITSNPTSCAPCPMFQWPDPENGTICLEIDPSYLRFDNGFVISLVFLTTVCFGLSLLAGGLFFKHRDSPVIKASSRELSMLINLGIVMSYVVTVLMLLKPSTASCIVAHFGFHLSFTVIYAPLFSRTNRIYRIFNSGKRGRTAPPRFVGSKHQIAISCGLILLQVLLTSVWAIGTTFSGRIMPSVIKPYVELTCTSDTKAFLCSLTYNLLLVLLCAYYAIKTRKLPSNFNESKFVTFCIYTTVAMWMAFVATYYTSSSALYRTMFLCLALFLNATVCLVCLFISKLYVIFSSTAQKTYTGENKVHPQAPIRNMVDPHRHAGPATAVTHVKPITELLSPSQTN